MLKFRLIILCCQFVNLFLFWSQYRMGWCASAQEGKWELHYSYLDPEPEKYQIINESTKMYKSIDEASTALKIIREKQKQLKIKLIKRLFAI